MQKAMTVLLSVLLIAGMLAGAASVNVLAQENIASGTDWTLAGDGTLTITSDQGMAGWIAERQDDIIAQVSEVVIASGVTSIESRAFYSNYCYCSLTKVAIPDSVTSIGISAFEYCESLEKVTMQSSTPPDIGFYADISSYVFFRSKFVENNIDGEGIYVPEGTGMITRLRGRSGERIL